MTINSPKFRKAWLLIISFIFIPAIVFFSAYVFREKYYSYIILLVAFLSLVIFILGVENKKTGSRRLAFTSTIIALGVLGSIICIPIPGVNPITAITILSAIYLGKESGFMIGAFSALISNMFSGFGMWTPFQMFALGMIGIVSGICSKILAKGKIYACLFSFISGFIYSFIMDIWTVIWSYNSLNLSAYKGALISALPFSLIYAVSNCIFAFILFKPLTSKLQRIKIKYGI